MYACTAHNKSNYAQPKEILLIAWKFLSLRSTQLKLNIKVQIFICVFCIYAYVQQQKQ